MYNFNILYFTEKNKIKLYYKNTNDTLKITTLMIIVHITCLFPFTFIQSYNVIINFVTVKVSYQHKYKTPFLNIICIKQIDENEMEKRVFHK